MKKRISFDTLKNLDLTSEGLSEDEVLNQRVLFGFNEIAEVSGNFWLELIFDTIKDPMIWFLLAIGSVFLIVGDLREGIVLFCAIVPLLLMDAVLHWRARSSTATLKKQLGAIVKVRRKGSEILLPVKEIVPGDLVVLSSGEFLPADGIFESIEELQIDESILTGESLSILKRSSTEILNNIKNIENYFIDSNQLGYAGSRVQTGRGLLRVLYTGQKTYYGEIIQSVAKLPHERTPLQKSIFKLVQILIILAAIFCVLLAAVRLYQGFGWLDAILSAATLAIAAIPEEFPVVFSFFLGVGVYRLAKKNALVRRAVSVENIGRVTYICTDKTGTITIGQLKLTHLDPAAKIQNEELLLAAASASEPLGTDPVDQAIIEIVQNKKIKLLTRLQVFPFTEDRKHEAAFTFDSEKQEYSCHIKGAPETILKLSDIDSVEKQKWLNKVSEWAQGGHKVLACGVRVLTLDEFHQKLEPLDKFIFLGLIVFEDPCRPEVAQAIKYCYKKSIGVLMITGDHPETAIAIAKDVGLGGASPKAVSAELEPEKFTSSYLDSNPQFLRQLDIVARSNPLQKLEIVKALRQSGELVAVTGDGVNDVPALKAADIAIAMGLRGTRSAKEVSSIVLADDNFQTVVNAIIEGKQLFFNLKIGFEYLLLIHIPFVLTAAIIPLMGYPLLYLPIHIVWLELIIHPSALFAFQMEASEKEDIQNQKIKNNKEAKFFTRFEALWIFGTGFLFSLALAYVFIANQNFNLNLDQSRTKALSLLMLWSAGIVALKTGLKNRGALAIFFGTVISTFIATQVSFIAKNLHISQLQLSDLYINLVVVIIFLILLFIGNKINRNN